MVALRAFCQQAKLLRPTRSRHLFSTLSSGCRSSTNGSKFQLYEPSTEIRTNMYSNRRLDNKFNIFEGLTKNWFFISISAIMCGGQVLIIFVGGAAFQIAKEKQSGTLWAIAL